MKARFLGLILGILFIGANLYAADGDLIVNGNVGIGTTSPTQRLDVAGNIKSQSLCIGTDCRSTWPSGGGLSGSGATNYISKWTVGTSLGNSLIYDNGSSVGIGTTSPAATLDVASGSYAFIDTNFILNLGLELNYRGTGNRYAYIDFHGDDTYSDYALRIMRDNTGPNARSIISHQGSGVLQLETYASGSHIILYPNGNVGIGTTNPTYRLYVSGSAYATSGWYSSDKKFKEDIAPIESALSKVLQINGVSFKWNTKAYEEKGFPEGKHYGVIAQDIEKVLPEAVKTVRFKLKDKDVEEGEKAVAYNELIPILIEAIKEQEHKIERLEAAVAALISKK